MKIRALTLLFEIHVVLLTFASTRFSVLTWLWGKANWHWEYFNISWANGWGYAYESPYSLAQVLTYVAAYLAGMVAFWAAATELIPVCGTLAFLVCLAGAATFSIELTHWFSEHCFSCIVSLPVVLAPIWIYLGIKLIAVGRHAKEEPLDNR